MSQKNGNRKKQKKGLHPRNRHRDRYDFKQLIAACDELAPFVSLNQYGDLSIDFANPEAVKMLNRALLASFYEVKHWDIPDGFLCPPIPGRADYIHTLADMLAEDNQGVIPKGPQVRVLDIGVGANGVYPIIGRHEYGWQFVGSDINPKALDSVSKIISRNPSLREGVQCRLQSSTSDIFNGIIQPGEMFDITLCNPPFHSSAEEAAAGTRRKIRNLGGKNPGDKKNPTLNFGGQHAELWCKGGEVSFIRRMISQSKDFSGQCLWFTTLVSKKENLSAVYNALKKVNAKEVRTLEMAQGQKISRIVAWSFADDKLRQEWAGFRW